MSQVIDLAKQVDAVWTEHGRVGLRKLGSNINMPVNTIRKWMSLITLCAKAEPAIVLAHADEEKAITTFMQEHGWTESIKI